MEFKKRKCRCRDIGCTCGTAIGPSCKSMSNEGHCSDDPTTEDAEPGYVCTQREGHQGPHVGCTSSIDKLHKITHIVWRQE